jgi:hypothetical protein
MPQFSPCSLTEVTMLLTCIQVVPDWRFGCTTIHPDSSFPQALLADAMMAL